jgi:tetratricopeptide (TPR) repeat protein
MNQPVNPYVVGSPVYGRQGFCGRQDMLEWVAQILRDPTTDAIVLLGPQAVGKTSLLLQLERTLPADAFLPVYFDLQGQAARPLGQVLAGLASALAERADLQPPGSALFDDQGAFFRHAFLPRFCAVALEGSRCPVFLLDEFEALSETARKELPETAAVKALLPFLGDVRIGDPRPVFVLAAARRAQDLGLDLTAIFDTPLVREVGCLDWESAVGLVRRAEVNGTLRFSDLAVSHILSFTSGHPYLTQLLCQRVWERAYRERSDDLPLIDTLAVEDAVPGALAAGGQTLAWLWDGLSPSEKVYTAALAELAGEREAASEDSVLQAIGDYATWLCMSEVESAPVSLVKRRVLEEVGRREHGFAIELFRLWVRQNKPLCVVEDEVGWVAPLAGQLFVAGKGFFDESQWESAVRCFQDALDADPHHLQARLHLGEALLELGQVDDAVVELVQAHELDRERANPSLTRALAVQRQARDAASSAPVSALPFPPGEHMGLEPPATASPDDLRKLRQDDVESASADLAQPMLVDVPRWGGRVQAALGQGRLVEVLRLVLPVLVTPVLSALVFAGIGISLATWMDTLAWMPPLFDASTLYRFGLLSAVLGLVPGLRFSYEYVQKPVWSLELVYVSLHRFVVPFLAVILMYAALALLAWISQVSVPEDQWEGFRIFFGWLRRLWESD